MKDSYAQAFDIAQAATRIADAITPLHAAPGKDAMGGTVTSLTEAVMGVTAALESIAAALNRLADQEEVEDPWTEFG